MKMSLKTTAVFAFTMMVATPAVAQQTVAAPAPATDVAGMDPERMAEATKTAKFLIPDGVYEKVLAITFSEMMPEIFGTVSDMRMGDIAKGSGADSDKTLKETLASADPHFEERMTITMKVMGEKMGPLMRKLEPKLREGMAKSYAKKFSVPQLQAMNAFFATPAGKAYADNYLIVMSDKEAMSATLEFMPEMMTMMMGIEEDIKKATAHLPSAPVSSEAAGVSFDNLPECFQDMVATNCSPEDRQIVEKFYNSIGIDLAQQEKDIAAQKAANDEYVARQAKNRAAWSAKDRAGIERLESAMAAQQSKADSEMSKLYSAEDKLEQAKRAANKNAGLPEEDDDAMSATTEAVTGYASVAEAEAEAAETVAAKAGAAADAAAAAAAAAAAKEAVKPRI